MDRRQTVAHPSPQDKRDLDRYVKFFTQKAVQVIVQSRKGGKQKTASKPNSSGEDWFNLAITDDTALAVETKDLLMRNPLSVGAQPVCVEISLQTAEEQSLTLENWTIVLRRKCERNLGHPAVVYGRLGLLLRSILSVSRTLPAYRMARKQLDGMTLAYRLYSGSSTRKSLGEGFGSLNLGAVTSAIGSLAVLVDYRTSMVLSDSFPKPSAGRGSATCITELPPPTQSVADHQRVVRPPEKLSRHSSGEDKTDGITRRMSLRTLLQPWQTAPGNVAKLQETGGSQGDDIPFGALLAQTAQIQLANADMHSVSRQPSMHDSPVPEGNTMTTSAEDFVVVDLAQIATPFASGSTSSMLELYRHCQTAGQLQVFQHKKTQCVAKADLLADLETMERQSDELDQFSRSL